jgi:Ca2+-binding EF-hand superfamily protein
MSISSIGSANSYITSYQGIGGQRANRPDPAQAVENLFSKLDTGNKGYLEKSDLVSAFEQIDSGKASAGTSVDDVFSTLDSDSDGKVTKEEMTSGLRKLSEELDSQYNVMRTSGMDGMSGMQGKPPPPPPQGGDQGLTQEEMSGIAETTSDSILAELMSNIASNFEAADADGDGKVTYEEAMAYQAEQGGTSSSSSSSTSTTAASTQSQSSDNDAAVMRRILDLMRAYATDESDSAGTLLNSLSATA